MPDEELRLEDALDQLYAADPSDFVTVRKQLSSALRAAGAKEAAKDLAGARRPSTSAWALNRLARHHPQIVDDFIERSNDLRVAQTGPAAGDREALREAMRAHRAALDAAIGAALAVLGARANETFRAEIVSTLRAAGTDPDVGRELRLGRVVRERESSSGFPETTGLTLVHSAPVSSAPPPRGAAKRASARELVAKDREAEARAKAEAERKADLVRRDAALERAAEAEADVASREAGVAELEAALDGARRALREARAAFKKANDEAARLSARTDRRPG
jgi:hypothetical protein